MENTGW